MASVPRIANRYAIEARLGSGVSGQSFRCRDLETQRSVVVKLAHDDGISQASVEFEAKALALLAEGMHPGGRAPIFYERGLHDYRPYIVQELISTPFSQLSTVSRLGMVEIWRLWLELCDLLGRAHRLGFVHGDLGGEKLEHLWWHQQPDGPSPRLVVIDWGNVAWPEDLTRTSALGFGDDVIAVATTIATLALGKVVDSVDEALPAIERARLPWPENAQAALISSFDIPGPDARRALANLAVTIEQLVETEQRLVHVAATRDGRTSRVLAGVYQRMRVNDPADRALPQLGAEIEQARQGEAEQWLLNVKESIALASHCKTDEAETCLKAGAAHFLACVEDAGFVSWLNRSENDPERRCLLGLPIGSGTPDVEGEVEDLRDLLVAAFQCLPRPTTRSESAARTVFAWFQSLAVLRLRSKDEVRQILSSQLLVADGASAMLHVDPVRPQSAALVAGRLAALAGWPPAGKLEAAVRSLPGSSNTDDAGSAAFAPVHGWGAIPQGPARWFVALDLPRDEADARLALYETWAKHAIKHIKDNQRSGSVIDSVWDEAPNALEQFVRSLSGSTGGQEAWGIASIWLPYDPRVTPLVRARLKDLAYAALQSRRQLVVAPVATPNTSPVTNSRTGASPSEATSTSMAPSRSDTRRTPIVNQQQLFSLKNKLQSAHTRTTLGARNIMASINTKSGIVVQIFTNEEINQIKLSSNKDISQIREIIKDLLEKIKNISNPDQNHS